MFRIILVFVLALSLSGCSPRISIAPERSSVKPSQVKLCVSSVKIQPGHVLRLSADSNVPGVNIYLEGWGRKILMTPPPDQPERREGFLAVPLEAAVGPVSLTVTAAGGDHWVQVLYVNVDVEPRSPFKTTWLKIRGFEKYDYASESRRMAEVRRTSRTYVGPSLKDFDWPIQGRITEAFGSKRVYNDGISSWYHGGLDIAALGGTIIAAPADGVVILAVSFEAHGNTVLIDHGYGVITSYLHQRKIYVKAGDVVERGQAIGEVGSTGGSTGNHLHFQINVHGLIADPYDFLKQI